MEFSLQRHAAGIEAPESLGCIGILERGLSFQSHVSG